MQPTAKFSNGTQDTYKGKRDVKAAWAIINENGQTMASGHSLTKEIAEKTARNHAAARLHWFLNEEKNTQERRRKANENAAFKATLKFEIVDL